MADFLPNTSVLTPRPPEGAIYFSQAHSLRWIDSATVDPSTLYREILSHALFFEALVISDSYAISNWLLKEMLPGGSFYEAYPGVEALIRHGAIRIARRRDSSLEEVCQDSIRREVPVMVSGHLTKASGDFLPHAAALAVLSSPKELTYDTQDIRLGDAILREIINVEDVSAAYDIPKELRTEIGAVVRSLSDRGLLYASELFNYPEKFSGVLADYKQVVQKLATSAHACIFPVTFGLPPVVSPNSDDHKGASAFYERFVPEIKTLGQVEETLVKSAFEPDRVVLTEGALDFTRRGVDPILTLRGRPEFRSLQQKRSALLDAYRAFSTRPENERNWLSRVEEDFQRALALYLGCVAEEYRIEGIVGEAGAGCLQKLIVRTSRQIEETRDAQSRNRWLFGAITALVVGLLTRLGVSPLAVMFAIGGLALGDARQRMVIRRLLENRHRFERAARMINLKKAEETVESVGPENEKK